MAFTGRRVSPIGQPLTLWAIRPFTLPCPTKIPHQNTMQNGTHLAAIDLIPTVFPEIGRYEFGRIQRVEYLKETVRQGSGLDEEL